MKTLKFMLAAATAIGLASATQADQYNTTGFEKLTVGDPVTTGVQDNRDGYSYFYYAGSVAEDNESVIAAAGDMTGIARPRGAEAVDAGRDKVLQVSTGTDPLMRTYAPIAGGAPQAATTLSDDVYVDTLVQFTVTPYTDTVTPGSADKLMVYLKESVVTNEFGEITSSSTNLVVVGGYYDAEAEGDKFVKEEYVAATTVEPGQWKRLTVKVIKNLAGGAFAETQQYPAFKIYIDNELCTFDKSTMASGATTLLPFMQGAEFAAIGGKQVVLSLLANGTTAATLQGVGFAGEGKVDDIVFSDIDPFDFSVVEFTLLSGTNAITAVSFTITGGAEPITQFGTYRAHTNDTVVITPTVAQGYEVVWPENVTGLRYVEDGTYVLTDSATLTLTVQDVQQAGWVEDPTQIADNTPAATQYPALAGTALATADAKKLTVWATTVANVDFSDAVADADDYVEAYLLNCAVADVDDEKDDFTLTITINAAGEPVVESPVDRGEKSYNGTVTIKGSTTLDGTYTAPAPSGAKFFKAELSL